jgi:hypothetical protein
MHFEQSMEIAGVKHRGIMAVLPRQQIFASW